MLSFRLAEVRQSPCRFTLLQSAKAASGSPQPTLQVMSSIKAREKELNLMLKAEVAAHEDELEVWQAERTKILRNKEADNAKKRAQLAAVGPKPKPPLKPILLLEEPTIEGLAKLLLVGQPSIGVFSPEGGEFVGGHAMKDDAKLRSAAGLSKLWDGEVWKRVRATDGAHTIAHKRVSLHLMLQPAIGDALISDAMLRDQGLVSRLLVTFPHTSMGTRLHRTPSDGAIKAVAAFNDLMAERIARRFSLQSKSQNDLAPRVLKFSTDAIKSWYAFGDKIEKNLGPDGELELISGFAGKMPEHSARLAAVMTWWANPDAEEVDADTLLNAVRLIEHYGSEALRLQQASGLPSDIKDALRLLEWLTEKWKETHVSIPDITQFGPHSLRVARHARKAVGALESHHWLVKEDGPRTIRGKNHRAVWRIVRPH